MVQARFSDTLITREVWKRAMAEVIGGHYRRMRGCECEEPAFDPDEDFARDCLRVRCSRCPTLRGILISNEVLHDDTLERARELEGFPLYKETRRAERFKEEQER